MDFKISYEDAKKILSVFYNAPYAASAPYVAILDNLKVIDTVVEGVDTLRTTIEKEQEATKQAEALIVE